MTYRPFSDRAFQWLADTLSIPPVVAGIALSSALGGLALWLTWWMGIVADVAAGLEPDIAVRAPVTLYMMVGYLPMAVYYLGVWSADHVGKIASNFSMGQITLVFPRLVANVIGLLGSAVMYLLFLHDADAPLFLFMPLRWHAGFVVPLVGLIIMGWFLFRFMFLLIRNAMRISQTARLIRQMDLFDTSLTSPYAQHGVRTSLLAVVCLSISATLWLDPEAPAIGTAVSLIMLVGASALALVLPTWGVHQQLKTLKQVELKQVRRAIAARRNPQTRTVDDAQQLRADLAVERRLMEISEWPFDAGSYGRVALYIFLGFGSWVGAALVERLLESL